LFRAIKCIFNQFVHVVTVMASGQKACAQPGEMVAHPKGIFSCLILR
jgi:hypothetical protein